MPKTTKTKTAVKFEFRGFVNLAFTAGELATLEDWLIHGKPDAGDCIQVLLEAGYKIGFSYDDYHDTNQVALTCKDLASIYTGYCFTFKHNDPIRSILICRWLYDSYLKNEDYQIKPDKGKFDW